MRAALAIAALTACHYDPPPKGQEAPPDILDIDAAVDVPVIDSPPGLVCPEGFVDLAGSKYFVQNDDGQAKHWKAAEAACEAMGTDIHLAVINFNSEADALATVLGNRFYWVGMFQPANQDRVGDHWTNLNGNPAIDHWAFDNPDDGSGIIVTETDFAQFAEMDGNGLLHDDPEDAPGRLWVCECDGVPVAPNLPIP